jgi:hypothetical protein
MPRKIGAKREAELLKESNQKATTERNASAREEFYPRLWAALHKCSEYGWRFFVQDGFVKFTSYKGWEGSESLVGVDEVPIPVGDDVNWHPWELDIVESSVEREYAERLAAKRKEELRQEAWSKLTPDEREALGMRRE